MQIAVLIACYNRREQTVNCIRRLHASARRAGLNCQTILFDDGSIDGTSEAVKNIDPDAIIIKGNGGYFWNRSMHSAFAFALKQGYTDYIWLNDDTMLEHEALSILKKTVTCETLREAIVVGAVKDPLTGRISYGGGRCAAPLLRPFNSVLVEPAGKVVDVDLINGNVVWIPNAVASRLGNLDPAFEHGMGDTDYSFRARKLGIRVVQTAVFVGTCSRNKTESTYKDQRLPLKKRLQLIMTQKGLPPRSWFLICARHGGILWPLHFLWAYLKVVLNRS